MKVRILISAAALTAAALTVPALAADPKPETAEVAKEGKVRQTKIICRTMHALGTRIGGKRICLTKEEWDDRRLQDRQALEKVQAGTRAPR